MRTLPTFFNAGHLPLSQTISLEHKIQAAQPVLQLSPPFPAPTNLFEMRANTLFLQESNQIQELQRLEELLLSINPNDLKTNNVPNTTPIAHTLAEASHASLFGSSHQPTASSVAAQMTNELLEPSASSSSSSAPTPALDSLNLSMNTSLSSSASSSAALFGTSHQKMEEDAEFEWSQFLSRTY